MFSRKIFLKFRHYWLTDDKFRALFYKGFILTNDEFVCYQGSLTCHSQYSDLFSLARANSVGSYEFWCFFVGLSFPSRSFVCNDTDNYYYFGRSLSLGGELFQAWKAIKHDHQDNLSSIPGLKEEHFLFGRKCALNGLSNNNITILSPTAQSSFLLGRDSILNIESLQSLISKI